jgi:hypothetical protein
MTYPEAELRGIRPKRLNVKIRSTEENCDAWAGMVCIYGYINQKAVNVFSVNVL